MFSELLGAKNYVNSTALMTRTFIRECFVKWSLAESWIRSRFVTSFTLLAEMTSKHFQLSYTSF